MTARQSEANRRRTAIPASGGGPKGGDLAPSSLAFLLSQVGVHASRRFAERLAALDLQPPMLWVLNAVAAAEGLSQQAIGEAIQASAAQMVGIIDELERRGLVERRRDPDDRRIHALHLTREGRELRAHGAAIAAEHEAELTRGMSKADRRRLVSLLQKIVDELTAGGGGIASDGRSA